MNIPVFDLHCDTAFALLDDKFDSVGSLRKNNLHIDLTRAGKLKGYAQCFACFTSDAKSLPISVSPQILFARELSGIIDAFTQFSDVIRQAFTYEDLVKNLDDGMISGILSIEGPAGFDFDPSTLKSLYDLGFRITTLGWNEKNPLCGSHLTGGGLTVLGKHYVAEAQRLGMLIDVSHISDEAFWDIINISSAPIIASHSNSRSVWNVSRNLTDEMFCAICKTGGVVGINLYSDFLGEDPDLDTVCDHIFHFLDMDPEGRHIALGGDLDGCDSLPSGFCGVEDYPKLADSLMKRGLSESIIRNIFWNNAMGVMKHCCM